MSFYSIKENEKTQKRRERQKITKNNETKVFSATSNLEEVIRQTKENVTKIAKEHRKQNIKFRDRKFDFFVNRDECLYSFNKVSYKVTNVKRVSTIFKNPKFFINEVEPYDVRQGAVNDCWFIASLAVVANMQKLLEKICVARDEEVGIYGFIFFKDGVWVSSIIDDQLFTNGKDEKENWKLVFAKCFDENETWLPLIEKAYAKIHGDYESISGGFTGQGLEDLTGGVYTSMFTSDILDKERFWNDKLKNVNKDMLFACARYGDADLDTKGTISGHAYSILRVAEIEDGKKLLLIRNPYGNDEWTGAWSDGSEEWTAERIKVLNYKFGDNGSFWMTYDDFLKYWDNIDQCRLFNSSWTVNLTWINYNVIPRSQGKFILTVPEESELVIVIQQLDDKYFSDPSKFKYQLSFRVYEEESNHYLFRSRLTVPYGPRSTNLEVTLPAGIYEIIPYVDRIVTENRNQSGDDQTKTTETDAKKSDIKKRKEKLRLGKGNDSADEEDETDEKEEDNEWEMSLGLRVYSKCTSVSLEGVPGKFPKKVTDEKKQGIYSEVDTEH